MRYGLTKNINTFNPVSIGYHEFADIVHDVRAAKTNRERVRSVLGCPGGDPSPSPTGMIVSAIS